MKIKCVCGKTLKIPDSFAGKKAKCPSCGHVISVGDNAPSPSGDKRTVQCSCGQKLAVPASAAGKKVRCPACTAIVAVPADEVPTQALEPITDPPQEDAPFELDFGGDSPDTDASDESTFEVAGEKCPNCGANLDAGVQFCVACGTHMSTGTKAGGVDMEEVKQRKETGRQSNLMIWGGIALVIVAIVVTLAIIGFDKIPFVGKSTDAPIEGAADRSTETSQGLPPNESRGTEAQELGVGPLEPRAGEGYLETTVYAVGRTKVKMNLMGAQQAVKAFQADHARLPESLDELKSEYAIPDPPDGVEYEYNPETGEIVAYRLRDRQSPEGESE